jgi:hypothetical protein
MTLRRIPTLAALLLPLAACAMQPPDGATDDDRIDETSSAIIRGEQPAIRSFTGVVRLTRPDGSGTCSGVMITNNWVLTAKHCFAGENTAIVAYIDSPETFGWISQRIDHSTLDVAMFRLFAPFPSYVLGDAAPKFSGYRRQLYAGTTESLQWQQLECFGYGISNPDYQTPSDGQLRYVFLPVYAPETYGTQVVVTPKFNADGTQERTWIGDSGGPCLWPQDGSVASIDGGHLPVDLLQRGYQTSVAPIRSWIGSIATF